jgi:O-antigen ligase
MYLEVLADAGAIGFIALLGLVAAAGAALWRRARHSATSSHVAAVAALAAWVVVAGHGLVDSFLSFTTTYVSFAVAAGLAFSSGFGVDVDAHRV